MVDKNEKKSRIDQYLLESIMIPVIGMLITFMVLELIFQRNPNFPIQLTGWGNAIITAILWTFLLVQTNWRDQWHFDVLENYRALIGNHGLFVDVLPKVNERTKPLLRPSLRERGSGRHGKRPWERVAFTVNMQTKIVIGSKLEVILKDGQVFYVEWKALLTPLAGYLANNIAYDVEAVKTYFSGVFTSYIQNYFKTAQEDTAYEDLASPAKLNELFKNCLGGKDAVDPIEKQYGWFSNDPQIVDITRSKEYAQAGQSPAMAEAIAKAIEKINGGFKGIEKPSPDMVLMTANMMAGVIKDANPIIVAGSKDLGSIGAFETIKKGGKK